MTGQPDPAGKTRPSMKAAMAMFNPSPPRVKKDGELIVPMPKRPKKQLPGQTDIYEMILNAELENLD